MTLILGGWNCVSTLLAVFIVDKAGVHACVRVACVACPARTCDTHVRPQTAVDGRSHMHERRSGRAGGERTVPARVCVCACHQCRVHHQTRAVTCVMHRALCPTGSRSRHSSCSCSGSRVRYARVFVLSLIARCAVGPGATFWVLVRCDCCVVCAHVQAIWCDRRSCAQVADVFDESVRGQGSSLINLQQWSENLVLVSVFPMLESVLPNAVLFW
jgi:hypothetical protein